MNSTTRLGFGLVLCLAVAACGDNKPAPVADAAPPPPPADTTPPPPATGIDGVYTGTRTRTDASATTCSRGGPATVRVVNGSVAYAPVRSQSFSAPVGSDGSFTATAGDSTFAGNIAGDQLTGTLDGTKCHYTLALAKGVSHGKHSGHRRRHHS